MEFIGVLGNTPSDLHHIILSATCFGMFRRSNNNSKNIGGLQRRLVGWNIQQKRSIQRNPACKFSFGIRARLTSWKNPIPLNMKHPLNSPQNEKIPYIHHYLREGV